MSIGLLVKMPNGKMYWYVHEHAKLRFGRCHLILLDETGVKPVINLCGEPVIETVEIEHVKVLAELHNE